MALTRIDVHQLKNDAVISTTVGFSQADMLALVAQTGDICIRNDLKKTFVLIGSDPTVLGDWQEMYGIDQANVAITGGSITGVTLAATPATKAAGDAGTPGQICWDDSYIYVCTAANTWKRAGITGGY